MEKTQNHQRRSIPANIHTNLQTPTGQSKDIRARESIESKNSRSDKIRNHQSQLRE